MKTNLTFFEFDEQSLPSLELDLPPAEEFLLPPLPEFQPEEILLPPLPEPQPEEILLPPLPEPQPEEILLPPLPEPQTVEHLRPEPEISSEPSIPEESPRPTNLASGIRDVMLANDMGALLGQILGGALNRQQNINIRGLADLLGVMETRPEVLNSLRAALQAQLPDIPDERVLAEADTREIAECLLQVGQHVPFKPESLKYLRECASALSIPAEALKELLRSETASAGRTVDLSAMYAFLHSSNLQSPMTLRHLVMVLGNAIVADGVIHANEEPHVEAIRTAVQDAPGVLELFNKLLDRKKPMPLSPVDLPTDLAEQAFRCVVEIELCDYSLKPEEMAYIRETARLLNLSSEMSETVLDQKKRMVNRAFFLKLNKDLSTINQRLWLAGMMLKLLYFNNDKVSPRDIHYLKDALCLVKNETRRLATIRNEIKKLSLEQFTRKCFPHEKHIGFSANSRLDIIRYLLTLATTDREFDVAKIHVIQRIAAMMRFPAQALNQLIHNRLVFMLKDAHVLPTQPKAEPVPLKAEPVPLKAEPVPQTPEKSGNPSPASGKAQTGNKPLTSRFITVKASRKTGRKPELGLARFCSQCGKKVESHIMHHCVHCGAALDVFLANKMLLYAETKPADSSLAGKLPRVPVRLPSPKG
ncbi:MAG: hypothetical protein HQM12_19820 [SAR324 cluster bacterium]|nr:hypothetical protein [SAR324 cluster bacterium]